MKDMMVYRGYYGSVHYSEQDHLFHGKLAFIRSLASYEGVDVDGLRLAFEEAVDDYLELCQQEGIEPERPFKGSFNVRIGVALHRKATMFAKQTGASLNNVVAEALKHYLTSEEDATVSRK